MLGPSHIHSTIPMLYISPAGRHENGPRLRRRRRKNPAVRTGSASKIGADRRIISPAPPTSIIRKLQPGCASVGRRPGGEPAPVLVAGANTRAQHRRWTETVPATVRTCFRAVCAVCAVHPAVIDRPVQIHDVAPLIDLSNRCRSTPPGVQRVQPSVARVHDSQTTRTRTRTRTRKRRRRGRHRSGAAGADPDVTSTDRSTDRLID